jgi:8-oxo-dGTP diphosphatase
VTITLQKKAVNSSRRRREDLLWRVSNFHIWSYGKSTGGHSGEAGDFARGGDFAHVSVATTLGADFMKRIDVAIAVVVEGGRVLICQRKEKDTFGGFWEFPGGKCEAGESLEQCLVREMREELAIVVETVEKYPPIAHDYPHVRLTLHPFRCRRVSGEPKMIECQKFEWAEPGKIRDYRFPPANAALLERIATQITGASADAPCNS